MALLGMVWTNLMRNKLRTILTWLSVFVALFLFVLLHGITDTLNEAARVGAENRLVTRNKISLVFPLPMSQYEKIRSLPGVTSATWSNWFGGQDPVNPHDFFAQFAVDGPTYFPMYRKDISIVQASPEDLEVVIDVEPSAMPLLADYIPDGARGQQEGGRIRTTVRVSHYHGLKRLVASMPGVVTVLAPEQARRAVAEWAAAGAARYA